MSSPRCGSLWNLVDDVRDWDRVPPEPELELERVEPRLWPPREVRPLPELAVAVTAAGVGAGRRRRPLGTRLLADVVLAESAPVSRAERERFELERRAERELERRAMFERAVERLMAEPPGRWA